MEFNKDFYFLKGKRDIMLSMKPHLIYARQYWQTLVQPGDTVVDATIGNGHDTAFLIHLLQGKGALIGYDIQSQAIAQTEKKLKEFPEELTKIISLKLKSHECIEEKNVKLIVYNLGYLPGSGNKLFTTKCPTTLQSIKNGLSSLSRGGAISITCYPGHEEGAKELVAVLDFLKTLPSEKWQFHHHVWLKVYANDVKKLPHSHCYLAPSLIWLQSLPDA